MHWTTTRVRYGETDRMGVVYHANYLVYFEIGRTELVRSLGRPYSDIEEEGLLLAVVEASVRYRRPARYDEVVRIGTRVTRVSAARIAFAYELRSEDGERLLAEATTELASVDGNGRPTKLPAALRESLEALVE